MSDAVLYYFVITAHVAVCFLLVVVVLLQTGKGADMGAAFGGGSSQTVFGSRGPATFFHYLTGGCAAIFILTSMYLSCRPTPHTGGKGVFGDEGTPTPAAVGSTSGSA